MNKPAAGNFGTSLAQAFALCMLALALLTGTAHAAPGQPEMVAIGFPATSEATISLTTLRAIFGMVQRKWPDGTPVKVFVLADGTVDHRQFSKGVLRVFPHQLRHAWERGVLSGNSAYPEQLASAQEMLRRVASTPGAIGYLRASEVDETVRVIRVEIVPAFTIPTQSARASAPASRQAKPVRAERATADPAQIRCTQPGEQVLAPAGLLTR
ncbi:MAG TPA: hypothetical protein PLS93_10485 [Accumulibacter sp.]|nr:hypothetical protein [Accumulibacter sp.]